MSSNAQRFAEMVLEAFNAAGHTTDELVRDAGGPSSTWMTALRKAAEGEHLTEPRSDTVRRIEAAAGWMKGSGRRVWNGGQPTLKSAVRSDRREAYLATEVLERLEALERRFDLLEARQLRPDLVWDDTLDDEDREATLAADEALAARRTPSGAPTPGQQRREQIEAVGEENQDPA